MADSLNGTVALVTGASSGIGAATARALASAGAAVALVARRKDRLEQVAAEITASGGTALIVVADITDQSQAIGAVQHTVDVLGRLDTVINNAGLMLVGPVAAAPDGEWERMLAVNVQGLLYVSKASLVHLVHAADSQPRRTADLVNVSSTAGRVARPGTAVYNLTKFGINAFSEALRQELQPQRVRVSIVEPGIVDTELASHTRAELRRGVETQIQTIEPLQPEDIADAIAYIVTSPRHVAINEMLIRAAAQSW